VNGDTVTSVTLTSAGAPATAAAGTYAIVPSAAQGTGLTNYAISYVNGKLSVRYKLCLLYDPTKSVKQGATIPIKLQLCNATGGNLSSSAFVVQAISVTLVSNDAPGVLSDSGNANPDNDFRYDPSLAGYIYNLSTKPLSVGTWRLTFTAQDSTGTQTYSTTFQVK
jgi:hypothetical protein